MLRLFFSLSSYYSPLSFHVSTLLHLLSPPGSVFGRPPSWILDPPSSTLISSSGHFAAAAAVCTSIFPRLSSMLEHLICNTKTRKIAYTVFVDEVMNERFSDDVRRTAADHFICETCSLCSSVECGRRAASNRHTRTKKTRRREDTFEKWSGFNSANGHSHDSHPSLTDSCTVCRVHRPSTQHPPPSCATTPPR